MSSLLAALSLPPVASPGMCLLVEPDVVWLHLLSDLAIGLAYLSIPAALLVVMLRRGDLGYPWLVGLFAAFILACGATHLLHAWAMFSPAPVTEGLVKAFTAAISVAVAVSLWPVLPKLLALRSPKDLQREVDERRAAEARARESEARMATFFANMAEALFVVRVVPGTPAGLVLETVNPAFERMFGIPAAQVVGQDAAAVLPAPLVAEALPRWHEAAERGETLEYELGAEINGQRLSWQTVLVPMRDAGGRVERLLGSARDVTATRRLQAGLVQSARLATVGTMCAGLAHEASQPLNTAALWLRRARAAAQAVPDVSAAVTRAVSVVEDQIRRAGALVTRIRALAGDDAQDAERFDAAEPATAALRAAAAQYDADGLSLELEGAAEALPVQGSRARLEQAILQLLANARDAVAERRRRDPAAPARIVLSLRRQGELVGVEVRDSGAGVPPALADAIFDPFFTTKEPGRGTGLGLPFAAAVARGMGGGVQAWNLPEGGACFRMELRLAAPEGEGAGAAAIAAA